MIFQFKFDLKEFFDIPKIYKWLEFVYQCHNKINLGIFDELLVSDR